MPGPYFRRHAGFKLGKFAFHIEALQVRLKPSGPRAHRSLLAPGSPSSWPARVVVVEQASSSPMAAFDLAIDSAERSVRRTLQKQRPRRGKPEINEIEAR